MSEIFVIRHGQASFGSDNYDQLSDLGRRQAQVVGEYLQDTGVRFDAVYSGDLQRQRDTAQLASAYLGETLTHHIDLRFNELDNDEQMACLLPRLLNDQPELEQLLADVHTNSKHYQKVLKQVFNAWVRNDYPDLSIQSWDAYYSNVKDALFDVMKSQGSGKTLGVFTSGGTIASLVSAVLGLQGEQIYAFYEPVVNCSITRFFYSGERIALSGFNDHSFLSILGQQCGENLVSYR